MYSRHAIPSTRENGEDVFQELATKLNRFVLPNDIKIGQPKGFGGFAEVHESEMHVAQTGETRKVAVKRFRVHLTTATAFAKSFKREVLIWKYLEHENILPLFGITLIDGVPCTVSEWMENGTMDSFLAAHMDVDILELVKGIACGLEYLHGREIIHSDLKGDNILISHDGHPVLSDFGLSRLQINSVTIAGTTSFKGNTRWMAPELIQATSGSPNQMHTKATDVWAFGMVTYQALSGKVPFYELVIEVQVLMAIINKQVPSRPSDSRVGQRELEFLWMCCTECWSHDSADRPTMAEVKRKLETQPTFTVEKISKMRLKRCWMSPTGRYLAIIYRDIRLLSFFDSKSMNRCRPDLDLGFQISEIAWSSMEKHIVTNCTEGILRKWSNIYEAPTLVAQSTEEHEGANLGFSPDDKFIASFCVGVKLFDASNLSLIWEYPDVFPSVAFPLSRNRIIFYSGYSLLDVNTEDLGNITVTVHDFKHFLKDLLFCPSGTTCIARTTQGVKILSADSFEQISSLPYGDHRAVQITPNGKYVLLALKSKRLVLWDIAAEEAVKELRLDVDEFESGEILRNCHALQLWTGVNLQFIHLASTYY